MLVSLYVENIAIIRKISLDLSSGFTILTGETGAGKSILIDSIGLLLGNKSRRELIGAFGESAFVKGVFADLPTAVIDILKENNIELSDGELFVERKITKDGRSAAKLNGMQVPLSLLQTIAPFVLNIHGQHDHITMLNSAVHIEYLDKFADLEDELAEYRKQYQLLREQRTTLQKLQQQLSEREVKLNRLSFKLEEYEKIQPYVGMLSYLQERRKILQNQQEIRNFLLAVQPDAEHSLLTEVSDAVDRIQRIIELDNRFKDIFDQLSVMQDLAGSVVAECEDLANDLESVETLSDVEDRLYALQQLLNRYGPSEQELLEDWDKTQREFEQTNMLDTRIGDAKEAYLQQLSLVQSLAADLSKKRESAAKVLSEKVQDELSFLDMKGVAFSVNVQNQLNDKGGFVYNSRGYDKVEFLISTNAGQAPKPLQKIASGGELSRIMLSMTNVLNKQQVGTLIFDEVDTGVSGKTAEKIGFKLSAASETCQVICITHLAQIASMGQHHFKISKSVENSQTETNVLLLNKEERVEEIARIIGGIEITASIRQTAREMLKHK